MCKGEETDGEMDGWMSKRGKGRRGERERENWQCCTIVQGIKTDEGFPCCVLRV